MNTANDTERPRWFLDDDDGVREYPSRRLWWHGVLMESKTTLSMHDCINIGHVELDGPPPHGKPLEPHPVNASESKSEQDLLIESLRAENARLTEESQRAASVRVVKTIIHNNTSESIGTLSPGLLHGESLRPGQSLAVIECPTDAALTASKERGA